MENEKELIQRKIEIALHNINLHFKLWLESDRKNEHHLECINIDAYDLACYLTRRELKHLKGTP